MRFIDIVDQRIGQIAGEGGPVVFDATEIAQDLDRVERENYTYPAEYYGRCAPPFVDRPFWVEATTRPDPATAYDVDYKQWQEKFGLSRQEMEIEVAKLSQTWVRRGVLCTAQMMEPGELETGARWVVILRAFSQIDFQNKPFESEIVDPKAYAILEMDKNGFLITDPKNTPVFPMKEHTGDYQLNAAATVNCIPFTLLALSFIHKRTIIQHIKPNRTVRKRAARQAGQKHGAMPLTDYYLIKVTPHARGNDPISEGDIQPLQKSGSRRAHEVMGHFRAVGEKGLFGRGIMANQLVWIPDHERGSTEFGKTNKGYKLTE